MYLQGRYLEMRVLGQQVRSQVVLSGIAKFLFWKVVSLCIPTSNVWEYLFLQSSWPDMLSQFFIFTNLTGKKWYHELFKFASLIMNEVAHLFLCLSTIRTQYTQSELSIQVFPPFFYWVFHSQLTRSLYIRDICFLSDICCKYVLLICQLSFDCVCSVLSI